MGGRGALLTDEQRQWFLEMDSTPGENAVKVAKVTTKDFECRINLVGEPAAASGRTDSNADRSSALGR